MPKNKTRKLRIVKEVSEDPRNILYYLSERGIPRVIQTAEGVIEDAKLYLNDEDYMYGLSLWKTAKKWKPISSKNLLIIVQKAMTKKYKERSSPRFPANMLCDITLKGNDGNYYTSKKQGTLCRWVLTSNPSPSSSE